MRICLKPKNDSHWHDVFKYEPSTGNLINRSRRIKSREGVVSGWIHIDGYVQVYAFGRSHLAHRVVWEMVNGPIPDGMEIDHINGVRTDNRLKNLRVVTRVDNMRNQKRRCDNTTGYTGVSWEKRLGKYRAGIRTEGVRRHLGIFNTAEEAHSAYLVAAQQLGFHVNHGRAH